MLKYYRIIKLHVLKNILGITLKAIYYNRIIFQAFLFARLFNLLEYPLSLIN